MKSIYFSLLFLSLPFSIFAQNQLDENDLTIGVLETTNYNNDIYYSNPPFSVDKVKIYFDANYLYHPIDTEYLNISANVTPVTIQSIIYSADDIQIFYRNGIPFTGNHTIETDSILSLMLLYEPNPSNPHSKEKLTIYTKEEAYSLLIYTEAVHIDYRNIEKLETIKLSQSKDKFLVIEHLGTITEIYIYEQEEDVKDENYIYYEFMNRTYSKIDLEKFYIGEYRLFIPSCDVGGWLNLTITE